MTLRKIKRWLFVDTTIRDLRVIQARYRSLYSNRFKRGGLGTKLGLIMVAYRAGHCQPDCYQTPKERMISNART